MPFDAFLKIDGIPGETLNAKHKDEIDVLSFSWGVTNTERGKVNVNDFSIVKMFDKSSPLLMMAACQGEHFPLVIFTADRRGDRPEQFLKITFTNVLVSSFRPGGSAGGQSDIPLEEVSLNFSKIEVKYTPLNQDGSVGKSVEGACNFVKH